MQDTINDSKIAFIIGLVGLALCNVALCCNHSSVLGLAHKTKPKRLAELCWRICAFGALALAHSRTVTFKKVGELRSVWQHKER